MGLGIYIGPPELETKSTSLVKMEEGKPNYAALPLDLLDGTAIALSNGAKKYGKSNYRKEVDDLDKILASLMRHLASFQLSLINEDKDGSKGFLIDEGGTAHIHNVIANALILINSARIKGYKV